LTQPVLLMGNNNKEGLLELACAARSSKQCNLAVLKALAAWGSSPPCLQPHKDQNPPPV